MSKKLRPVDYVVHNGEKLTNVWINNNVIQLKGHVPVKKALADAEYYSNLSDEVGE